MSRTGLLRLGRRSPREVGRGLLWAAVIAGLAGAGPAPGRLRVGDDGRFLVDVQGTPVFLDVDTAWGLARLGRNEAEAYLSHRKGQEFNAVAFVLYRLPDTEQPERQPFQVVEGKPDPARPLTTPGSDPDDPAGYDYWDHIDALLDRIESRGLYAIVLPAWGSTVVGSHNGSDRSEVVFDRRNAYAYGRWLGRRHKARANLIWMLGGDRAPVNGPHDDRPVFRALAEGIADGVNGEDAQDGRADFGTTLMSYHPPKTAPRSSAWFHDDPWLDFNSIQAWPEDQVASIARDYALAPVKPTWLFEGRYEGYYKRDYKPEDWGEWQVRQQAYQTVFSGGFGHTYGHERVFGFGEGWRAKLDEPGARSMGPLHRLMTLGGRARALDRIPDQGLVDGDEGEAGRLRSTRITATRTRGGGAAMLYIADGRDARVRMDRLAGREMAASWFNPRNGRWHADGTESAERLAFATGLRTGPDAPVREFDPPGAPGDGNDWVLVLETRD